MSFEYSKTEDDPDTIIGQIRPPGSGEFWQGGFTAHFELDALDSHAWPSRGFYFKLGGEYFPAVAYEDSGTFGAVEGRLTGVIPIYKKLALATQVGGRQVWGDYPYYKAAYIGGGRTLRGYDRERFGGDGAVYANLDLRFPVSNFFFFLPGEVGLFGFIDTGRVFYAGESSNKWHTGYGGGIWVAPLLRQLTLSLAVAGSEEGTRIYVTLGMGY
jgi:hemolysin activation/secretion protein